MTLVAKISRDESGELYVPLADSLLDRLGIAEGDEVHVTTARGSILLRPVEALVAA